MRLERKLHRSDPRQTAGGWNFSARPPASLSGRECPASRRAWRQPSVSLACVEDDAQGQTLEVLWDIEPDARAYESDRWHGLGTREFDKPAFFAAYLNTLRWNSVSAKDATMLQAPLTGRARIEWIGRSRPIGGCRPFGGRRCRR